jgi:peptide/nickel transport system permease protein
MRAYLIKRIALIFPTLFFVTLIVFALVRFVPGSAVDLMAGEMAAMAGVGTEITREDILTKLGLDIPVHVQYANWLGGVVHGDLGRSIWTDRPITQDILKRVPISLQLGLIALASTFVISIPIGVYSAIRQDTIGDYIARSFAILMIAVPSFWIATMVMVFPSIWWDWSPPLEYVPFSVDPLANLRILILPALILGLMHGGTTMRMTRTMMLEVLKQDYIRTAWAKGLRERLVVMRHAVKNALIPVITIIGFGIPTLIGGSVVIETIFNLPGIGRLMVDAINQRDYPVISGINLMMATAILFVNLSVDLTYAYLDPRIRYT